MQTPDNERESIFENQFTCFMVAVVRNARNDHVRKAVRISRRETLLSEIPEHLHPRTDDNESSSSIPSYTDFMESLTNPQIYHAVKALTNKQKQALYLNTTLGMAFRVAQVDHCRRAHGHAVIKSEMRPKKGD